MAWTPILPLIAILRGIRPEETVAHVGALIEHGFDTVEIPLNSPGWQTSIGLAVEHFGTRMCVGGGTVLTTAEVDTLAALGARLVVAPNMRPAVIRRALSNGMAVAPGIATPTEAFAALEAGATALKVFPVASVGPGLVRALRAVLPPVPLYAVGGVTPGNLKEFLVAGCTGAGLGSELYRAGQSASHTADMAKIYVRAFRQAAL